MSLLTIDFPKLREPFLEKDIEWRIGQSGITSKGNIWAKVLAYLTNRAIMQRLDDVVGPENWKNEYANGPGGGVVCGISILVPRPPMIGEDTTRYEGKTEWVTKWDGADNTAVEAIKGGLSDAMKRAAVQWGIGRYLYNLDEGWATLADDQDKNAYRGECKDAANKKHFFRWHPPKLPEWALPPKPSTQTPAAKQPTTGAQKLQQHAT